MNPMFHIAGQAAFWMHVHCIAAVVAIVGAIFFFIWALRHLSGNGLRTLSLIMLGGGLVVALLTAPMVGSMHQLLKSEKNKGSSCQEQKGRQMHYKGDMGMSQGMGCSMMDMGNTGACCGGRCSMMGGSMGAMMNEPQVEWIETTPMMTEGQPTRVHFMTNMPGGDM
jgi:hypothetical protein